jgi:hypothetical protein
MKWTIRTELAPDRNEPITRDIGTITRSIADLYREQRLDDPRQDFPLGEICSRDTLNAALPPPYVPLPSICIGLFGATDHPVRRSVNIRWATQGAGRGIFTIK